MSRSRIFGLALVLLFAAQGVTFAQPAQPKPQAAPAQKPAQPSAEDLFDVPMRPARGALVNIRLDLTITDQRSNSAPATKTVTMLLSDRNPGKIRTSGDVKVGTNFRRITLNVDATPEVLPDGRIRVGCNLEYAAQLGQGTQEENQPTNVSETFNVILADGKQTIVSQSADPASDRKVQVELKATLAK